RKGPLCRDRARTLRRNRLGAGRIVLLPRLRRRTVLESRTSFRAQGLTPCTKTGRARDRRLRAVGEISGGFGVERGSGGAIPQFGLGLEAFDRGLLTRLRSSRGISRGVGFAAVPDRRRGLVRGPLPTLGLADRGVLFDEGLPHDPPRVVLTRIELLPVHVLEVVSEVTLDAVLRTFGHPPHLTDELTQLLCVFGQALGSDHDQGHNDQDHHFGAVDTQHASKSTVEAGSIDSWSAQ